MAEQSNGGKILMNIEQTEMWDRLRGKPGNYYQEAPDSDRAEFRKWVHGLLNDGQVQVSFIKSDGSEREMTCTLSEVYGAKYKTIVEDMSLDNSVEVKQPKPPNNDVCRIWDCDAKAWRSFRWDRLKRIQFKVV